MDNKVLNEYSDLKIPLVFLAKNDCRKCYGRGFIGRDIINNKPVGCGCTLKTFQLLKDSGLVIDFLEYVKKNDLKKCKEIIKGIKR